MNKLKRIKNLLTSETAYLIYMTVASIIFAMIIVYQLNAGLFPTKSE